MRKFRPIPALIALAVIGVACGGPGASSGGGQSQAAQASQGGAASQPAASTGGGGGGGGGTNGSIHYEITGDATKSGDLSFFSNPAVSQFINSGWVAYFYNASAPDIIIQINSNPASHGITYSDGEILVVGTTAGNGCTVDYSRNDSGGLKGTIDCQAPVASNVTSGALIHVKFHATVDAHT